MHSQILEQLFDSSVKAKLLKLFLRNSDRGFQVKEAAQRTQSETRKVKKQIEGLAEIGFLKIKKVTQAAAKKSKGKNREQKDVLKPGIYYSVNRHFDFYTELANLVLKSVPTSKERILNNLKKLGRIKLAVIAGVFLNTDNSRTDMLIIGEINRKKLENFLTKLEAEVGREINYSVMSLKEFEYRYHMFDRFLRDIFEKPHEKLICKIRF